MVDGHRALMSTGGAVVGAAALIWIEGPDAARFLHGLLTADVAALAVGATAPALLLDARGRIQADLRLHRDGPDAFTAVVGQERADALAAALADYHFSEDLDIIGPEAVEVVTVVPAARAEGAGADLAIPGIVSGTRDLAVADPAATIAALGLPAVPADALEILRIEHGVPRVGTDTDARTLVHEAGLTGSVSFTKGCYLGQETVARVEHRGGVRRHLRGLRLTGRAPVGAEITLAGRPIGRLTSVAESPRFGPIGLAILRDEATPGAEVAVGPATAAVVTLPFA